MWVLPGGASRPGRPSLPMRLRHVGIRSRCGRWRWPGSVVASRRRRPVAVPRRLPILSDPELPSGREGRGHSGEPRPAPVRVRQIVWPPLHAGGHDGASRVGRTRRCFSDRSGGSGAMTAPAFDREMPASFAETVIREAGAPVLIATFPSAASWVRRSRNSHRSRRPGPTIPYCRPCDRAGPIEAGRPATEWMACLSRPERGERASRAGNGQFAANPAFDDSVRSICDLGYDEANRGGSTDGIRGTG